MRPKISVVIISKNEESIIRECLSSVHGWADEILVLDSGSDDSTVEICKEYADRVIETDWPGYGRQKIKATAMAQYDWVMSVDADEVLSDELKREIDNTLQEIAEAGYTACKVPFRLKYFGKYIRSLIKRHSIVLFDRRSAGFVDLPVHETVCVHQGKVKKLKEYIYHHGADSLQSQLEKFHVYAMLWSEDKYSQGKKSSIWNALIHALNIFIKTYIVFGGIFDGWRGALLSLVYTQYTFNKYIQLMILHKTRNN